MSQIDLVLTESQLTWRNQRATVRYRCAPATLGKILLEDSEFQRAWVINLSESGICLLVARPLPIDNMITVVLKGALSGRRYELRGRIAHTTQQPNREWIIGCEVYGKLSSEELDDLL